VRDGPEQLLALEIDTIHGLVPGSFAVARRLRKPGVHAVLGWSRDAGVLALSDRVATRAGELADRPREPFAPDVVPEIVERLAGVIRAMVPEATVTVSGGPCFVFPEELVELPAPLPIVASGPEGPEGHDRARDLVRPANWEPGEWQELVAGHLGTWAMALDGDHPVSICHSPAATDGGVEAGVWTRADHRGAGLAPAVTRAWWSLERRRGRVLFYSTSADNHASRAVARKLRLHPLGWLWTIR
jgi:hypothetical protein